MVPKAAWLGTGDRNWAGYQDVWHRGSDGESMGVWADPLDLNHLYVSGTLGSEI